MPAAVRDILLLIRSKEEASRAINNVAASMRRAGAAAEAASARARAAQLRAAARQAQLAGATRAQVVALQQQARAYDQQAAKIEQNRKRSMNLGHAMENVGRTAQTVGMVMIGAGVATAYGLKKAVDAAVAWDKQVRLTYTQVDKRFKPSLQELSAIGLRVAHDIAIPFENVQEALFDVFSSTEANLPQAEKLLRSFAKAAVAGNTDVQTASRATIGLMNAYQVPFKDVNKLLDIQFQLVQEGVGTYEEWAQRIGLVTPSAVRAGQSIETMAAALATATRLGTSAARAGTAVARAFDAMSNPKTEASLKRIGVNVRDAKGNFRPLVAVLADWRKELEKMPKEDRIKNILDTLKGAGSTIEARRFLQNILLTKGGLELFQDQIKEFATDKGAFQNAYNEMAGSVAAKTQLLRNAWMSLKVSIGEALMPTFSALIGKLQGLLDWFNRLPKSTKSLIAQFLLWGSILAVVGGAIAIFIGAVVTLAGILAVAGAALTPMLAAFAAVGAVVTVATAAIAAFGIALYTAYQRMGPIRSLLITLKEFFAAAFNSLRESAIKTWQTLSTTLGPGLRAIWDVIQNKVVPAITTMVNWLRNNLLPVLQAAWRIFLQQIQPALQHLGDTMRNYVAPAIAQLTAWWNRNKASILPLIKILGVLVAMMLLTAGTVLGAVITAVSSGIRIFLMWAKILTTTVRVAWLIIKAAMSTTIAVIKAIINWFSNLGSKVQATMSLAKNAVQNGINAIKGFFSGAGSWLISAGRDMVMGLVNGIRGAIGSAASAAADMAKSAITAAKNALIIKSPSRVFRDIGANVVRGFVLGVQGNRKKIQSTMFALARDIRRSINDADISRTAKRQMLTKWNKQLAFSESTLLSLEAKRAKLQTKLNAATTTYNNLVKARTELVDKIRDSLSSLTDLTSLDEAQQANPQSMIQGLKDRFKALVDFQNNLLKLRQRGFDQLTIADLATKGVDAAGGIASQLANATDAQLSEINSLQQQIRNASDMTANNIGDSLYKAGIQAAQGLIKGLDSQIDKITAQMVRIANALVAAIKKQLGIRSPSTVFQNLGVNTAQGYINGYVESMNAAQARLAHATMFNPAAPIMPPAGGGNVLGTQVIKNYYQDINISTQEIDPRKHSAELGWELQARM